MATVLAPAGGEVIPTDPVQRSSSTRSDIAFRLSAALAVVTAAATGLTFLIPDVLRGPAVMNGSGRGTHWWH
jgi:hypothetical protein